MANDLRAAPDQRSAIDHNRNGQFVDPALKLGWILPRREIDEFGR